MTTPGKDWAYMQYQAIEAEEDRRYDRITSQAEARAFLGEAACRVGDEAVVNIVLPVIERVMRGDCEIVDLKASEDAGLVKVVRVKGSLAYRLRKLGVDDQLAAIAVRFSNDFAKARLGGLTANYGEPGGGSRVSAEPERWAQAMDVLTKASACLDRDERIVLYGYVLFDVSAADLGAFVAGHLSPDKNMHKFTGKLLLNKALIKLSLFYEGFDHTRLRHLSERNIA